MALLELYVLLLCSCSCLFQRMDFIKIHTGVFLNGIYHGDTLKRLSKIHFHTVVADLCSSKNLLRHKTVQVLGQIHHAVVIGVCLIQFH